MPFLRWVFAQRFRCRTVQTDQTSFQNTWEPLIRQRDMNLLEFHTDKLYFIIVLHLGPLSFVFWWEKLFFFVQNFFWFVQQKWFFVQPLWFLRDCDLKHSNKTSKNMHMFDLIFHCIFSYTFDILNRKMHAQTFVQPIPLWKYPAWVFKNC